MCSNFRSFFGSKLFAGPGLIAEIQHVDNSRLLLSPLLQKIKAVRIARKNPSKGDKDILPILSRLISKAQTLQLSCGDLFRCIILKVLARSARKNIRRRRVNASRS
jgi:hypothetical protein